MIAALRPSCRLVIAALVVATTTGLAAHGPTAGGPTTPGRLAQRSGTDGSRPGPASPRGGLTASGPIAAVYDAIFDARFERVPALLDRTCPPAPDEVCSLLAVVSLGWEIQIDPANRSRDAAFVTRVDAAIAAIEAWTKREPERAEAWFYLGGAYGARAQWRVMRKETIAAARDGKRIKDALEQALELDPALQDAWFGIGLYHYYADVAPTAAKMLRFLLALPGGDKEEGMREMLRAKTGGQLLRDEADYQVHILELWYEDRPQRALDLLRGLRDRHPDNPLFIQLIAQVEDVYMHDPTASLRTWRALFDAAQGNRVALREFAETTARLGMAAQLDQLHETDRAIEHLQAVIAARPRTPADGVDRARDMLARAQARLNGSNDTARAYRLSIEGWRAFERGRYGDASRAIAQSVALRPNDQVTRYRQARLLDVQGSDATALNVYESIVRTPETTPPVFFAMACLDAARLYESQNNTARAIELYDIAQHVFGADQRTRDAAQRAFVRLSR